jgi:hypothetical protein
MSFNNLDKYNAIELKAFFFAKIMQRTLKN